MLFSYSIRLEQKQAKNIIKYFFAVVQFDIINKFPYLYLHSQYYIHWMQQPLSPSKSKSASFRQIMNLYITPITSVYPGYEQKIKSLAFHKQLIITSPKSFVNLFESKELNTEQNSDVQLEAWSNICELIIHMFKVMPINSTFVYKEAIFVVFLDSTDPSLGYRNANSVEYIIIKIFQFLQLHSKTKKAIYSSTDQSQSAKLRQTQKKIIEVVSKLYVIYHSFMQNCCIPTKTLKLITQILCSKFYSGELTIKMLQISFNMLSQLNDPTISTFDTGNLQPFIYFNGSAKIGLRLLLTNNKWPFNKGMHLCLWLKSFLQLQTESNYIVFFKVDEQNWLAIRQERTQLVVQSLVANEKNKRKVCDIPIRTIVKLQVALEPKETGIFKSNVEYRLHLRVNGEESKNVQIKLPRFDNSDFVTEFNMFGEFVGQFYSLALWKSINSYSSLQQNLPNSLQSEQQVNSFLEQNENIVEDMLTLLSPLRVHKGILINLINGQQNHACHQATMLLSETENKYNRFVASFSQIILPYLYFLVKVWRECIDNTVPRSEDEVDEIKFECEKFTNTLLQQYCKSRNGYWHQTQITKKLPQIKNSMLQNYKMAVLYILYWLQVSDYLANEPSITALLELTLGSQQNFQPLFYKYLDLNLLASKNYKVNEVAEKLIQKNLNTYLKNQQQLCNPVTKLQLLFFLETSWKQLWNRYQYMTEWWEPINLKMQSDQPFDYTKYQAAKKLSNGKIQSNQNKTKFSKPHIQWCVSQFITNDFCDCLIVPLILDPTYKRLGEQTNAQTSPFIFSRYQELYNKKQCMTQDFKQADFFETVLGKEKQKTYKFKKQLKSIFSKLMDKVSNKSSLKSQNGEPNRTAFQLETKKSVTPEQNKSIKFQSEASYLNLLTLIIGTLTIQVKEKSGFIYFSQKHASKMLDHMCVKAYKNEQFIYICFDLGDVREIKRRRFNQSMNGMQIRLKSGHGYLFYFHEKNIDKFISFLKQNTKNAKNRIDTVFKDPYDEYLRSNHTTLWIDKQISNWEYLQWLNDIAGRSYNDITQYPVLPWVFIQGTKNPQQCIGNQASFRDLTKNMGSFGPQDRISHFKDKYENVGQHQIFSEYHFGTHYSSSAIIFNFLIRLRPFSVGAVTLQSGKFDCADRVFSSYIGSWANATNSPTDIRELIPQIFLLPQMMININGYDFGLTQLKERICNVDLPKWADHNPYVFCKNLRKALQSDIVSKKINNWIDLIYGYKQKGQAAVESMNIFFPLTYELAINIDKISDPEQKMSIQTQIAHFGQNPAQIIGSSPHPLKSAIKQKWQNKLLADCNDIVIQKCSLTRMNTGQVKFIFQSVFEDKNSILSIKFMTDNIFLVLRRYQYCLFKILDDKQGFISKQKEIQFITEKDNISLDYQNIATYVPMVTVIHRNSSQINQQDGLIGVSNLAIVGGFYNGTLQIIYLNEVKASGTLKMPFSTVTALAYSQDYKYLYIGDSVGKLGVYLLKIKNSSSSSKQLQLVEKFHEQVHDLKINSISINKSANLFLTASQDGSVKLFNLYSQQQYRKIVNPSKYSIVFARISTCPLYCIVFYSEDNSMLYSYSINGQFLGSFQDTTGFIYNMSVLMATNHSESLVYLNAQREIYILELPQLKTKKKIRLKKDEHKISCFEMTNQIAIAGSQDGALQIIADPSSF